MSVKGVPGFELTVNTPCLALTRVECGLVSILEKSERVKMRLNGRYFPLEWRHNAHDGVSNHQPHDCLLSRLFRRRSKKISKLRVTGLCEGNSPVTGEFPAQRASNAENDSIWWRHHECHKGTLRFVLAKYFYDYNMLCLQSCSNWCVYRIISLCDGPMLIGIGMLSTARWLETLQG